MSSRTELWYRQHLLQLVKSLRQGVEGALNEPDNVFLRDSAVNDEVAFNIDRFLSHVKRYQQADIDGVANNIAHGFTQRGDTQNANETAENLKRQTGIDLREYLNNNAKVAERVEELTTANIQLIKSIHSQYLDKVQTAVTQGLIKGQMTKGLAAEIRKIGDVTENRAKLIARDQSSKLNAALTRARHEELGITKYKWSTSQDERVRDSHAELDGKIFSYDDPPSEGNPGDAVNCRCVAIAVIDPKEIEEAEQTRSKQHETDDINKVRSVEELLGKVKAIEPEITQDMTGISSKSGGKLVGLENRLKSSESLQRKINSEIADGFSEKQALNKIRDALRYTAIFKEKEFSKRYKAMQYFLLLSGYKTIIVKNTWRDDAVYKGINTFIEDSDGNVFEMQYHTQQSFDLKNGELHKLYEKFRDPNLSQEEKERLLFKMKKLSSKIKMPKDIENIKELK